MANDPDRYKPLCEDWNMGPFYVLVDGNTGDVLGDNDAGAVRSVILYRTVGQHFFDNAKANKHVIRRATIQLVGEPIE
jgi:hypothetical protein